MENFFDKRLRRIVIINLLLLALFLLVKSVTTISDLSLRKKSAAKEPHDIAAVHTITFNGTSSVKARPDTATFIVTVKEEGDSVINAQQKMVDKANKAIELFNEGGAKKSDIQTKKYNTRPKYSFQNITCVKAPCEPSKQVLTGYEATQVISVKFHDIDKVEEVLTSLAQLEINDVVGPALAIEDPSKFQLQAQAQAIEKVKEEAKVTAKNLGVTLGKIVSFSEGPQFSRPHAMMMKGFAGMAQPDIEVGEQEVSSTVSITYEIK
jgi:uncharacterized protein